MKEEEKKNNEKACGIEFCLNVVMVTKVHTKQKWLPQSPLAGSSKASKIQAFTPPFMHSPRILKKSGLLHQTSLKSSSVSFSISSKDNYSKAACGSPAKVQDDVVLGSWIKPKNPRRALDYDLYGYHCWVSRLFIFCKFAPVLITPFQVFAVTVA